MEGTPDGLPRCSWARGEQMQAYHDREWGVPVHDDRAHFELLCLEGAQAGLSWRTILARRDGYRRVFRNFEPHAVAGMDEDDLAAALSDPGIIRNRRKVESVAGNARAFIAVQEEHGSFDRYIWSFVDGRPVVNRFAELDDVPATTPLAAEISRDLRRRGFRFVGPTIVYAHLQSAGLVMDHVTSCFRYAELAGEGR